MFYCKGNIPSSKNSKRIVINKRTGKPMIISSQTVQNYRKKYLEQWKNKENIEKFKSMCTKYPILLHVRFIRDSKRIFDYCNAIQLPQDLMVEFGWLPDDNTNFVKPIFEDPIVDKARAGIEFWIEGMEDE